MVQSKKKQVREMGQVKESTKPKGRPKGTRKKRLFEQTRLGFMLKYETPLEYSLILEGTPRRAFIEPSCELIESICFASGDLSFKKKKFKTYLAEYQKNGIYCDRPKTLTPEREAYYTKLKLNKIKTYTSGQRKHLKAIFQSIR